MIGALLLRSDRFLKEVAALEPPWTGTFSLERYLEVFDEGVAAFERYLKSGSGRAFAKRHFG